MYKTIFEVKDINIPALFKKSHPSDKKYMAHLAYYNQFKKFKNPTVVDKSLTLVDGYCNYLICKSKNIKQIECYIDESAFVKKCKIQKCSPPVKRKHIGKNMRIKIYLKYNGVCVNCRKILQLIDNKRDDYATIDHIKPLSKGGKNHFNNYQLMCRKCNSLKSDIY